MVSIRGEGSGFCFIQSCEPCSSALFESCSGVDTESPFVPNPFS